jgi:hypothetical protein
MLGSWPSLSTLRGNASADEHRRFTRYKAVRTKLLLARLAAKPTHSGTSSKSEAPGISVIPGA